MIALALASPFYDLAVIQIAGIADIRMLEVLWLVTAISLALRIQSGSETRFIAPPRWFTYAIAALATWFFLAAIVSGGGIRPIIEAIQTVYLCVIAYLVVGVVSATDAPELARWLRPWAIVMGLVLLVSLAGYVLGFQPVAQTVVPRSPDVDRVPPGLASGTGSGQRVRADLAPERAHRRSGGRGRDSRGLPRVALSVVLTKTTHNNVPRGLAPAGQRVHRAAAHVLAARAGCLPWVLPR